MSKSSDAINAALTRIGSSQKAEVNDSTGDILSKIINSLADYIDQKTSKDKVLTALDFHPSLGRYSEYCFTNGAGTLLDYGVCLDFNIRALTKEALAKYGRVIRYNEPCSPDCQTGE